MKFRLYGIGFALLLVLLALVLYRGSVSNSRTPEEQNLIWDNPAVGGGKIALALRGEWEAGEFRPQVRPVATTARWIEHAAWTYDRGKYQIDQILLHAIAGILVFLLIRKWLRSSVAGGAAGLIFVAHPAASQSVLYLGGISEILCAIFAIGALLAIPWEGAPSGRRLAAIGILAFLSMLSKEIGFAVPFIAAGAILASRIEWERAKRLFLPLGAALIGAFLYRTIVLATLPEPVTRIPAIDPATGIPPMALFPRAIAGIGVEIAALIAPVRLNHDESWLLVQHGAGLYLYIIVAILGIAAALWLVFRRGGGRVGAGLALLAILPLLAAAAFAGSTGTAASERNVYIPLAAFAGLLPMLALRAAAERRTVLPVLAGAAAGLILLYGVRTGLRTKDYADIDRLLASSNAARPNNPEVLYEIGNRKLIKADYVGAADLYKQALAIRPDFPLASVNLGAAYLGQEDLGMALRTLDPVAVSTRHVRAMRMVYAKANYHAGLVLMKQERYKEAAEAFERMLRYYPDSFGARLNLGLIYIKAPHYAERGIALLKGVLREEQDKDRRAAVEKSLGKAEGLMREYLDKNGSLPSAERGALGEPWNVVDKEGM